MLPTCSIEKKDAWQRIYDQYTAKVLLPKQYMAFFGEKSPAGSWAQGWRSERRSNLNHMAVSERRGPPLRQNNIASPLQSTSDIIRILVNYVLSLVFTTRPPHAAAETSVRDFTEKLIADESVCSDYKSATLLMRWEVLLVHWGASSWGGATCDACSWSSW